MFNENTCDPREKYYNKMLCNARVVTENWYGMLKGGRWRILYKKNRSAFGEFEVYYHGICNATQLIIYNIIATIVPCNPRWILEVENLQLLHKNLPFGGQKRICSELK